MLPQQRADLGGLVFSFSKIIGTGYIFQVNLILVIEIALCTYQLIISYSTFKFTFDISSWFLLYWKTLFRFIVRIMAIILFQVLDFNFRLCIVKGIIN